MVVEAMCCVWGWGLGWKRCVWSAQAFLCVLLVARVLLPSHVGVISSKILEVSRQRGQFGRFQTKKEKLWRRGGAVHCLISWQGRFYVKGSLHCHGYISIVFLWNQWNFTRNTSKINMLNQLILIFSFMFWSHNAPVCFFHWTSHFVISVK